MSAFYVSGGSLGLEVPSYVERQADKDLLEGLLGSQFCYVLTSRQMGKSSLMIRTAHTLRRHGVAVAVLDLTALGQNVLPEQWYGGLMAQIGARLGLEDELEAFWWQKGGFGPAQRFFMAIRQIVLTSISEPVVIFVDEIDVVRSLPFSTDEFFAAIRECYNRRTEDAELHRLTFCLLGVATPSDLIRETRMTPFNIGRRIELHDFTPREAAPLACGLLMVTHAGASPEAEAQAMLRRILYWTGGHPYLTQRLCRALATPPCVGTPSKERPVRRVDRLCAELFFTNRAREQDDNLIFVRERMLHTEMDRATLLHFYERVQRGRFVRDDDANPLIRVLLLAGIARLRDDRLVERNRIYQRVFDRNWIRANMPDAEVRRQKAAFRRGVIRTTGIAAVVVGILILMTLVALDQASKARRALANSNFYLAQARRVSSLSGQRYDSVNALREARPFYENQDELRNELIASLALVDLKPITNEFYRPAQGRVSDLNLNHAIAAVVGNDGSIHVRRLDEAESDQLLPPSGLTVKRLRFDRQAKFLLAEYRGPAESEIVVWNWQQARRLFTLNHGIHAQAVDFDAQGCQLAVGEANGRVTVYSLPEGDMTHEFRPLKLISGLPRIPQVLRFNPSGDRLAEASLDDQHVQVWNLRDTDSPMRLYHAGGVYDLSWNPQGTCLAAACADFNIYLWNLEGLSEPVVLSGHEDSVVAVAFSPCGNWIASAGLDETIRLWVLATGRQVIDRLDGQSYSRLHFRSDGHLLRTTDGHSRSAVWQVLGGEYRVLEARPGLSNDILSIDFSPDGQLLGATGPENAVFWTTDLGQQAGSIRLTNALSGFLSADGRHLWISSHSGLYSHELLPSASSGIRRIKPGVVRRLKTDLEDQLDGLGVQAWSPDRKFAALVHRNDIVQVSSGPGPADQFELASMHVGRHYHRLSLHPDGHWVAAMIQGQPSLDIWNFQENGRTAVPDVSLPGSEYFHFSLDGEWLIHCRNSRFQFWRVGQWIQPAFSIPRKHASSQHAPIATSVDGALAALATSRYTIELFRLPSGNRSRPIPIGKLTSPDRRPLQSLAFSPDARLLAAATRGQVIQLWNLASLRDALAELDLAQNWPEFP